MKKIRLLVLDIDGVMTDSTVMVDVNGNELYTFSKVDSYGIEYWKKSGYDIFVLSRFNEQSMSIEHRLEKLKIDKKNTNSLNKKTDLKNFIDEFGYDLKECAYIGDDLNDLPAMKLVGLCSAPKNSYLDNYKEYNNLNNHIDNPKEGGHGAIRWFIDYLLEYNKEF